MDCITFWHHGLNLSGSNPRSNLMVYESTHCSLRLLQSTEHHLFMGRGRGRGEGEEEEKELPSCIREDCWEPLFVDLLNIHGEMVKLFKKGQVNGDAQNLIFCYLFDSSSHPSIVPMGIPKHDKFLLHAYQKARLVDPNMHIPLF